MLTELCLELRNWFELSKYFGEFSIEDGELTGAGDFLQDGQYFRIIGSVFNDGVHQYPVEESELKDEVFKGAIWAMAVPPAVIDLSERIQAWNDKYGDSVSSPYSSESFGGYSYTKASSGQGDADSGGVTWRGAFANDLNKWRKL